MENLDSTWISEYEKAEKPYNNLYPKTVDSLKIYSLYINNECILDKVKEDYITLKTPNCITKKELIKIIKNKKVDDNIAYKLISLLKYNVDLKPDEIKKFIYNYENFEFIDNVRELGDIHFYETIPILQDLNSIFLIYYEFQKKLKNNKTKKIYLHTNPSKRLRKTKKKTA